MSTNGYDIENGKGQQGQDYESEQLRNALTNTVTLSPELFERIYLGPKGQIPGDLRKRLANPTPIAVMGFSVGLLPLSIELMGWRGSGGTNATQTTTCSIWFGGVLLLLGGIGEFLIGNTFPAVVFFGYSAHFLTFATTFMPFFGAVAWNAEKPGEYFAPGPGFAAGYGFYPLALGMLSFVFLVGSLRTNGVFLLVFVAATLGFSFASASLWYMAAGKLELANKFIVATGAAFFTADMAGWYLLLAIMITIMELPIPDLPLFDLTRVIKARPRVKQD